MQKKCPYQIVCKHYQNYCPPDLQCIYKSMIDRQVFKSRINKRIIRREHGHGEHELPKESWTDSGLYDREEY